MPIKNYPRVGVAVIIERDGQVLLVKRKNAHGAGTWALPGGHLEFGESLEECAIREIHEEVGVTISGTSFAALTNDIFASEDKHYITIWMRGTLISGEPCIAAHREVSEVSWFSWNDLPSPLFLPLQNLLDGKGYPGSVRFFERRKSGRVDSQAD
jgi:8-oxo-dGTP diphosphatase